MRLAGEGAGYAAGRVGVHRRCVPSQRRPSSVLPVVGVLPYLDGLRGVAVLLVLLYHGRVGLDGGYVGVDVFLVLSGFLVTSLLVREHDEGTLSLLDFWSRRVRRLLPLSAFVAAVSATVGVLVLEPQRLARLPGDVLGVAAFAANLRFLATHGDYLGGLSLPSPLLHFWSLALEEQFYLVWPAVLWVVLGFAPGSRRRVLVVVTCVLVAASLLCSVLVTPSRPSFSYYLLPARAWELLAGALLSLCWCPLVGRLPAEGAGRGVRSVLGLAGLLVLAVVAVRFDGSTMFPGWAALLPVGGTLAVLAAGGESVSGRVLSLGVFRWLGVRSYGAYLWHWPLLVFAGALGRDGSAVARVVLLLASVLLADLSLRGFESPVRSSTWLRASPWRSVLVGVSVSVSLVVVSSVVAVVVRAPVLAGVSSPVAGRPVVPRVSVTLPPSASVPSPGNGPGGAPVSPGAGPRVLLLGDSTLAPLRWFVDGGAGLDAWASTATFVLDAESCRRVSMRSCVGREDRRPDSAAQALEERLAAGERYRFVVLMAGYHSTPDDFAGEFDAFLAAAAAGGVEKVFVPEFRESLAFPLDGSRGRVSVFAGFNDVVRSRASSPADGSRPSVVVLPWNSFTSSAGDWFRADGIHVNVAGAIGLGEFLARGVLSGLGLSCGSWAVCVSSSSAEPASSVLARYGVLWTDEHCYELGEDRVRGCRLDPLR